MIVVPGDIFVSVRVCGPPSDPSSLNAIGLRPSGRYASEARPEQGAHLPLLPLKQGEPIGTGEEAVGAAGDQAGVGDGAVAMGGRDRDSAAVGAGVVRSRLAGDYVAFRPVSEILHEA